MDKVRPLKIEPEDEGFYTETDPSEDGISAKGIVFEDSDDHTIELIDNEIAFKDPVSGQKKLSELLPGGGLTESSHRLVDQLVHNICENSYLEIIRISNKISSIIYWTSSTKVLKIREYALTYTNNFISSIIAYQYDSNGDIVETLIMLFSRNINNSISSISYEYV